MGSGYKGRKGSWCPPCGAALLELACLALGLPGASLPIPALNQGGQAKIQRYKLDDRKQKEPSLGRQLLAAVSFELVLFRCLYK